ncbi:MAG: sugar phosphate isomerase/epimerase [Actinomycetota bacterium]|nr:sugar phosphate isomerase/epimerase [Actinomycetota bacterium]
MVTTSLPYKFGVSQFTTWPWSFEQDVDGYARLGVDAIEVCEDKLDEGGHAGDQLELIVQHGLTISSVQPAVRTLFPSRMQPEPEALSDRTALFCRAIERVGRFAQGTPFVCNTGPPPNGNIQEVFDVAPREYRALADFAQDCGASIALEPLSPVLMNVETAIWTLEQAMRIVAAVDRTNFGVCVDVWNLWQNASVTEEIKACGDRVFVVHISDWQTPRSFADRRVVGRGEIPLPALIHAIHGSGYRGAYTLEIFSSDVPDSLWDGDLSEVVRDSRIGLEKAWREAGEPS